MQFLIFHIASFNRAKSEQLSNPWIWVSQLSETIKKWENIGKKNVFSFWRLLASFYTTLAWTVFIFKMALFLFFLASFIVSFLIMKQNFFSPPCFMWYAASLCRFFAAPHREGLLLIWMICLFVVKCPSVFPQGLFNVHRWSFMLPITLLIAFQLHNKIVIYQCLDCSLRWYNMFIPSERRLTLRCEVTLLSLHS